MSMNNEEIRETLAKMLDTWDAMSPADRASSLEFAASSAKRALAAHNDQNWRTCGGCSGTVVDVQHRHNINRAGDLLEASWGSCGSCGAFLGTFASEDEALGHVQLDNELVQSDDVRGFDIVVAGRRIHGFMDAGGRMTQIG